MKGMGADLESVRKLIPGMRLVLDEMKDPHGLEAGSQGSFEGYDAVGDLMMSWDSGSSLKLIEGVDRWHVISSDEEIAVSLAHEKGLQDRIDRDDEFICPRCGKVSIRRYAALSRIADIMVCGSSCGTIEAIIAAQAGGLEIKVQGANEETERDFRRRTVRDWKMVRSWMGIEDF